VRKRKKKGGREKEGAKEKERASERMRERKRERERGREREGEKERDISITSYMTSVVSIDLARIRFSQTETNLIALFDDTLLAFCSAA